MRKQIILCIALCLICLAACGRQETDEEIGERIAGKIYVYEKEGTGGGEFTIYLGEDGVYTYEESPLSSYIGRGSWTVEDGFLILTEDEDRGREEGFANRFRVEEEELVYLDGQSSNFLYIDADDGDRFRETPLEEIQVPVLAVMTEEELIREIIDQEHFYDLLLSDDSVSEHTRFVYGFRKKCKALDELLKRENAAEAVLSAIQSCNEAISSAELERDGLKSILDYLLDAEKESLELAGVENRMTDAAAGKTDTVGAEEKELIRRITADEHFSELLAGEHAWEKRWAVYWFGKNCEELEELLKREDAAQIVLSAILERNCEILAHETDSAELERIRCERDGLRYILDYLLLPEKQPRDAAQGPEEPQELQ